MIYREYTIRFYYKGEFVWRYVITALSRIEAIVRAKQIISDITGMEFNSLIAKEVTENENSLHHRG